MSFFRREGSKSFYQLFLSYFALILIVIGMLWPVYQRSLQTVKSQAVKDSYSVISNGFDILSMEIQDINQSIYNLYSDPNIKQLAMMDNMLESADYYRIMTAQRYLVNLFRPIEPVEDCFIIFRKNDLLLGRQRVFDIRKNFYGHFIDYEDIDYEQWLDSILNINHKAEFWPEQSVYMFDKGSRDQIITYLLTLPHESVRYSDSVAVIMLNKNQMLKLLGVNDFAEGSWIYLADSRGNIILRHNYVGEILEVPEDGIVEMQIEGADSTLISKTNLQEGIQLVAGIPESVFVDSVKSVRILLVYYLTFALLGGIIISVLFSYRQSKPWRKLFQYITSINTRTENDSSGHEVVIRAFEDLAKTKEQLYQKVTAQQDIVTAGLLERLFHNKIYSYDEYKMITQYLSPFPAYFRLVMIKICDSDSSMTQPSLPETQELLRILAIKELKDVFGENVWIHPTGNAQIILIAPQLNTGNEIYGHFGNLLNEVQDTFYQKCDRMIHYGISARHQGVVSITAAYNEAQQVLRYRDDKLLDPIIWFEDMPSSKQKNYIDYEGGQKLYQLLLAGERQAALSMLDDIFNKNIQYSYASNSDLKQIYYSIRGIILHCAFDVGNCTFTIPEYDETSSVQELFQDLCGICQRICDASEQKKQSHNTKLKDEILSFIHNNYARQELCGELVSDKFGISVKYLFNFIKEQTGRTFGDHLETVRLDRAKEMMLETELSINQIATRVGFISQNTFYKVFKRIYGLSPSVWRSNKKTIKM